MFSWDGADSIKFSWSFLHLCPSIAPVQLSLLSAAAWPPSRGSCNAALEARWPVGRVPRAWEGLPWLLGREAKASPSYIVETMLWKLAILDLSFAWWSGVLYENSNLMDARRTRHISSVTFHKIFCAKWPCHESSNPCMYLYDVGSMGETSDCFRRGTSHIASAVAPFPTTWRWGLESKSQSRCRYSLTPVQPQQRWPPPLCATQTRR